MIHAKYNNSEAYIIQQMNTYKIKRIILILALNVRSGNNGRSDDS